MPEPSIDETEPVVPTEPVDNETDEPALEEDADDSAADDADLTDEQGNRLFTDPKKLPPEMMPIFKQMQASFTKEQQKVKSSQPVIEDDEEDFEEEETPYEPTEALQNFKQSDEGKLFKNFLDDWAKENLGDVIKTTTELKSKEMERDFSGQIDTAITKYGKENMEEHYDQIQAEIKRTKGQIPLDYICANILYGKAKESGVSEFRAKLRKKNEVPKDGTPSPAQTDNKPIKSFGDAFKAALETAGQ